MSTSSGILNCPKPEWQPLTYDIGVPVQRQDTLAGGGAHKVAQDADADAAAGAAGRVPGAVEPLARLAGTGGQGHRTAGLATIQALATRLGLETHKFVPPFATRNQTVARVIAFLIPIRVAQPVARCAGSGNGHGGRRGGGGCRGGSGTHTHTILLLLANVQCLRFVASRGQRLVQGIAHFQRFRSARSVGKSVELLLRLEMHFTKPWETICLVDVRQLYLCWIKILYSFITIKIHFKSHCPFVMEFYDVFLG